MTKIRLSVIIPVYNVEKFIGKCLDSVEHQDLSAQDYEIIVVDDGSPDKSKEIAQKKAKQYTNIQVVSRPNGGLSAARNTGLDYAKGEYIMFVDSDDWIAENCLTKLVEQCERQHLDMLQICAANMIDGVPHRRFSYDENRGVKPGRDLMANGLTFCAPFSVYNKSFLTRFGLKFHPGIFHEDNEFTPRAYYFAERVGCTNDIIYYVYQNPNSITRIANPQKAFDTLIVMERLEMFCEKYVSESFKHLIDVQQVQNFHVCIHESIK